jgi:ribokinase
MKSRPRIVVIGSLVFDFVAKAARIPKEGETILGDMFGMFPGGKGANQAVQAGRLGAEVFMVGRVGVDFLGDQLLASLGEAGVSSEFVKRDPSVKTAACCIHVSAAGQNSIIIVPEANSACSEEDVNAASAVIQSADIVLCQLEIPIATVSHAAQMASRCKVVFILNPAPAQLLPDELLRHVSYLTPNETEAEQLSGVAIVQEADPGRGFHPSVSRAGNRLLSRGSAATIITLAERGAYYAGRDREAHFAAFPVKAVDTTAAGDAFNGALAVALGEGRGVNEAIRFANAAGALATTRAGAQPSMATRDEVERLLRTTVISN